MSYLFHTFFYIIYYRNAFFIALYGLHIHFVYLTKYLLLNKRVTIIDTIRLNETLVNGSQSSINSDCLRINTKTGWNKNIVKELSPHLVKMFTLFDTIIQSK